MHSTVKTILVWVLILVAAVGLYNFVEHGGSSARTTLSLTDFLNRVDQGQVAEVVVSGSTLTGRLTNNETFRSTIPQEYTAVYERLTARNVRVTIVPPEESPWLGTTSFGLPAILILGGSLLWLAISAVILVLVIDLSRFVKRELARRNGGQSTT